MRRGVVVAQFLRCLLIACAVSGLHHPAQAENDAGREQHALARTAVPFLATIRVRSVRVHKAPATTSPEVGLLREGATVTVTSCQPDCLAVGAWALLGLDGAVPMATLAPRTHDGPVATAETLWYGRVGKMGVRIFKEPHPNAQLITRKRLSREMAFTPNPELKARGWFERADGGFVRLRGVEVLTPSEFRGQPEPQLPFAFAVRDTHAIDSPTGPRLQRYERIAVQHSDHVSVTTDKGQMHRSALRIVEPHTPPPLIPMGAKWVLVDLSQETLTAYEGATAVYATLISSGKDFHKSQSHVGLFQVEQKLDYSDMRGVASGDSDAYQVDRVPYTLYYHDGEALHGTYWHDRFGYRASHGCINLSLADARWLFDWSPPRLPENWSGIEPKPAGLTSLWVSVIR